jgi:hypothetical protein
MYRRFLKAGVLLFAFQAKDIKIQS